MVARVYAGTGANQTNISCLAGHLVFSTATSGNSSGSNVVTIDQNGVATALQPGSVLINANISNCIQLGRLLLQLSAGFHHALRARILGEHTYHRQPEQPVAAFGHSP